MSSLPTVEICAPWDMEQRAIINADDFTPGVHILWADRDKAKAPRSKAKAEPKSEKASEC